MPYENLSLDLALFLASLQDPATGGVHEPGMGKNQGTTSENSYGTSFYALLCAKKSLQTKKEIWKKRTIDAVNFEIKTAACYSGFPGIYRWEFKNYALL